MWPFYRRKQAQTERPAWERTSTTTSLTEQRTYLPDTPYLLPKDAQEDQRLNYQRAPREV